MFRKTGKSKRTQRRHLLLAVNRELGVKLSSVSSSSLRKTSHSPSESVNPVVVCSLQKFQPVLPLNCETQDSLAFEIDFLRVAVRRGLGRRALNDFLTVLNKHKKGNFPTDARACIGSLRVVRVTDVPPGRYHHFGLENCISRALQYITVDAEELGLQFNVDGLPISRSSTLCFWPILGRIVCPNFTSKVLLVGLFCGPGKPDDVSVFLAEFIADLLKLLESGVVVGGKKFILRIHSFVCDAPARQFLKCIKSHNAYSSCERCTVEGCHDGKSVRYCIGVGETIVQRSNASFRAQADPDHHIDGSSSPLTVLPVDFVADFPLDYMHMVLLGVVKKILRYWLGFQTKVNEYSRFHKLPSRKRGIMNVRALKMSQSVPVEFQRKPRSFTFIGMFKATEYRTFLCYTAPYVMLALFDYPVVYNHFMCLVVAMRILLTPNMTPAEVLCARNYLAAFVSRTPDIYGLEAMVYNMHGLTHLTSDCEKFGSLDSVCSFPFESYLCKLKQYIKRPGKELEQVVKRVHEQCNFELAPPTQDKLAKLLYKHENGPLGHYDEKDVKQYLEVRFQNKLYGCRGSNDVIFCSALGYCVVKNIISLEGHVVLLVSKFKIVEDVFSYPCKSSRVGFAFVKELDYLIEAVHVREVCKCWCVEVDETKHYVVKLLHESR